MQNFSVQLVSAVILVATLCPPTFAGSAQEMQSNETDRAAIHAAVKDWAAASAAKDVEGFVSVYAEDGVVMMEGAPDLRGLASIREGIGGMMQDPNFSLWFEPDDVVVAQAGDLAYETGTYGLSISDPEGNPVSQNGHYIVVWGKQPDGQWKVLFDVPVSDPPSASD